MIVAHSLNLKKLLYYSKFSPTTTVMTAGSPPSQPQPPTLSEAGVTYLILTWQSRPSDEEYSLQMEDPTSGHGYLGAYNGNAPHCTCIGLKRYTDYKFRLKAYVRRLYFRFLWSYF